MRWLLVPLLGIALGAATSASDAAAGGLDQTSFDRVVSMVLNAGFVWAGAGVLAGWLLGESRLSRGALAGVTTLVAAVLAYYAYGVLVGDRTDAHLASVSGFVRLWAAAAFLAGPVLGAVGVLCRRAGVLGFLARIVVPVGATVELLVLRHLDGESFRVDPALAWTQAAVVGCAALSVLAAATGLRRAAAPGRTT